MGIARVQIKESHIRSLLKNVADDPRLLSASMIVREDREDALEIIVHSPELVDTCRERLPVIEWEPNGKEENTKEMSSL